MLLSVLFQKSKYHRSHSLNYKNGYALPTHPTVGIGGEPIVYNQLNEQELDELANYNPTLTYGQAKQAPPEDFVPGHVAWDKKVTNHFFKYMSPLHWDIKDNNINDTCDYQI